MAIVNRDVDMAGKIRIVWQMANGDSVMWKFSSEPTTEQLEALEAKHMILHEYDNVYQIPITITEDVELIRDFIQQIKDHPTVTLTQFNTWLSTKQWQEDAQIRVFIFKLAQELANRQEVQLSDYTQAEILGKLRNWIVDAPIKKIAKVIFGDQFRLGE
jgi:hypothetical protein